MSAPVSAPAVGRSRLRFVDRIGMGFSGLGSRPARTLLTALGIAIGIASMVAVVGISSSSKADLLAELDDLGTNLLQVRPGQSVFGDAAQLPNDAEPMLGSVVTVERTAGITTVATKVQRNMHDDTPNGLAVVATNGKLDATLQLEMSSGVPINDKTQQLPVVVLGSKAAERLAITNLEGGPTVSIAGRTFQVVGILKSHPLHPDLDRAAFIGHQYAQDELGMDPNHTSVYLRVRPDAG